jgi:hypothetical protein
MGIGRTLRTPLKIGHRIASNPGEVNAGEPEPRLGGGGENPLFNRVTFYRGGDKFIRFLERRKPGIVNDLEKLYGAISAAPEASAAPAKPQSER